MLNHYYIEKYADYRAYETTKAIADRQLLIDACSEPSDSRAGRKPAPPRYAMKMARTQARPRHMLKVGPLMIAW